MTSIINSSQISFSQQSAGAPGLENRQGVWTVTSRLFSEKIATVCKAVFNSISLSQYFEVIGDKNPMANALSSGTRTMDDGISALALPTKAVEFFESASRLSADPTQKRGVDFFFRSNNLVNPVYKVFVFFKQIGAPLIDSDLLKTLSGFNGIALFIDRSKNLYNNSFEIKEAVDLTKAIGEKDKADKQKKVVSILLKIAQDVSYFALSVLIISSVFFNKVAYPIAFTALASAAVAFAIIEFYHTNLGATKKSPETIGFYDGSKKSAEKRV